MGISAVTSSGGGAVREWSRMSTGTIVGVLPALGCPRSGELALVELTDDFGDSLDRLTDASDMLQTS